MFEARSYSAGVYLHRTRVFHGRPRARAWLTLSSAPYAHRLTRTAPDEVELQVLQGRMLETSFEQLMRSSALPVRQGMQRRLDGVEVTVTGLDQGLPSRVRLRFDQEPERADYTFAQFVDGKLAPLTLPPVGQSLTLPRQRGLFSP